MTRSLCWTAARRGSADAQLEDPLAFSGLEAQIGNLLWPGFTRHTSEPAYYVMACYGLLIAEKIALRYGLAPSDDTLRALFHRWERLWVMAVCMAHEGKRELLAAVRGGEGARLAYVAQGGAPTLDYRLISRRHELGALGAYLTSLREHELVRADRLRLTPLGWDLAQWMWQEPSAAGDSLDELLVQTLRPGNSVLPKQLGRAGLAALGKRGSLTAIASRPGMKEHLWRRLFAHGGARFAVLEEMAGILIEAARRGPVEPRELFDGVAKSPKTSSALRDIATLAICFGDLTMSLRGIFDRMYRAVLSSGYASDWGACVHAAIPAGFAAVLNSHIGAWRRFASAERMLSSMLFGPKFIQVVRRMNSQNAYHIFESVLHLHVQMQRMRGKGAWIDRKGEVVYLRHTGYESFALEGSEWAPGYRVEAMRKMLTDLGRLP